MRTATLPRRDLLDGLSPMERARELDLDGAPLCQRVAEGSRGSAIREARAVLACGDVDEALVWIERAEPHLCGLARAIGRAVHLSFGAPAPHRNAHSALELAADRFARGDLVEAVAQIEAAPGFHGLSRHLTARAGA